MGMARSLHPARFLASARRRIAATAQRRPLLAGLVLIGLLVGGLAIFVNASRGAVVTNSTSCTANEFCVSQVLNGANGSSSSSCQSGLSCVLEVEGQPSCAYPIIAGVEGGISENGGGRGSCDPNSTKWQHRFPFSCTGDGSITLRNESGFSGRNYRGTATVAIDCL